MGPAAKTKHFIVVIDGPAASGKSTTARLVAGELGWLYLDTGAMYRAMAVKVLQEDVDLTDSQRIGKLVEETKIELVPSGEGTRVMLDDVDISDDIRTPEIDRAVGPVCEVPRVREIMMTLQRTMGNRGPVVAEGRDMGTVVFPDADLKFYMVASAEQRAIRRQKELTAKGIDVPLEELKADIEKRDERDSRRAISPLKRADDAVLIDTTSMDVQEQVEFIIQRIHQKYDMSRSG